MLYTASIKLVPDCVSISSYDTQPLMLGVILPLLLVSTTQQEDRQVRQADAERRWIALEAAAAKSKQQQLQHSVSNSTHNSKPTAANANSSSTAKR
jgi:hypothetical protein